MLNGYKPDQLLLEKSQAFSCYFLLRKVMDEAHIRKIAQELHLTPKQVQATADLLNEGATIPFISRYRKEVTGSLDEIAITAVRDRVNQLMQLDKRREVILKSLGEREQLTDELKEKIL